jgi:hypothetical protein
MKLHFMVIVIFIALRASFSRNTDTSITIRTDVYIAKTADQFNTAYFKSTNTAEKIAALQALPLAIKRFSVDPKTATVPEWLGQILNDALNSADLDLTQVVVEKIGNSGLGSVTI